MTGTELVEVVARAMFSHEQCDRRQKIDLEANWLGRLNDDNRDEYRDLARAVLAALTEAGTVEWGLLHGDRPRVERCFTERYAKQCAAESESTLVSRLTLPWTVVEQ